MYLANNIKHLRQRGKLTQEDIATQIGKSKGNVSAYEKGKSLPPIDVILQLCDIFQVNLDDLVNKDLSKEGSTPAEEASTVKKELTPENQSLLVHLLKLKVKELAKEIEHHNKERYNELDLDDLLKSVEKM